MAFDDNPFITAHKPVEDGFPFVVAVSYTHLTLPTNSRV